MARQTMDVRKDFARPMHMASKSIISVTMCTVMLLLLLGSVAATSRSVQNYAGYDIQSRNAMLSGLGGFPSHRTMTQRDLLQDKYGPPGSGTPPEKGGENPSSHTR